MNTGQKSKKTGPNVCLRTAREKRGWSQRELANQLGTSELTVGRWERGERKPQLILRAKLCELFGMTVLELGLIEEEQPHGEEQELAALSSAETAVPSFPPVSLQEVIPSNKVDKKRIWGFYEDHRRFIVGVAILFIVGISVIGSLLVHYPFSPPAKADVQSGSRPASQAVPLNTPAWAAYDKSIVEPGAKPVIDDPLTRSGPSPSWHVGHHCNYVGGIYHEYNESVNYCPNEGPIFYDLEFHIVMRITQGEEAGIIFRADGNSHLYYFYLDVHGNYGIHLSDDKYSKDLIPRTASPVIKQGEGLLNQLAVIARGKDITLYINGQYVNHFQDTHLSVGRIGICVGDYHDFYPAPFNATYQDAKVWNLKP